MWLQTFRQHLTPQQCSSGIWLAPTTTLGILGQQEAFPYKSWYDRTRNFSQFVQLDSCTWWGRALNSVGSFNVFIIIVLLLWLSLVLVTTVFGAPESAPGCRHHLNLDKCYGEVPVCVMWWWLYCLFPSLQHLNSLQGLQEQVCMSENNDSHWCLNWYGAGARH